MVTKEFAGCDDFVETNELANSIFGMNGSEQMDVILITTHLFHLKFVSLLKLFRHHLEGSHDWLLKKYFSILDWENDVIMGLISAVMTFFEHLQLSIS